MSIHRSPSSIIVPITVVEEGPISLPITITKPSTQHEPSPLNTRVRYPVMDKKLNPKVIVVEADVPRWTSDQLKVVVTKTYYPHKSYSLKLTHPTIHELAEGLMVRENTEPLHRRAANYATQETYSLTLPDNVKRSETTAVLKRGVLTVTIPLRPATRGQSSSSSSTN